VRTHAIGDHQKMAPLLPQLQGVGHDQTERVLIDTPAHADVRKRSSLHAAIKSHRILPGKIAREPAPPRTHAQPPRWLAHSEWSAENSAADFSARFHRPAGRTLS
jgi:hypothetical protein